MNRKIPVFFYGSFIIPEVLEKHGYKTNDIKIARLDGFDVKVDPLTRLVRSSGKYVYGIICYATHKELRKLYSSQWMESYLPEPVLAQTMAGEDLPVLTYLPDRPVKAAIREAGYLEKIIQAGRSYLFPESYIKRLEEQL